MASNTYGSDYLQGWADANAGLYSPPGTNLQRFLANAARLYELERRKVAYDDGYHDREGTMIRRDRTPPSPPAPR